MSETLYALILRDGDDIFKFQLYRHEERCREAKAELERGGLWGGPEQSVECESAPVICAEPHGWADENGEIDLGVERQ